MSGIRVVVFFWMEDANSFFSSALGGKVSLSREAEYVKISWEEREERKCRRPFAGRAKSPSVSLPFFSKDEEDSRISKLPCFCPLFPSKKSQKGFFCLLTNPLVFLLKIQKIFGNFGAFFSRTEWTKNCPEEGEAFPGPKRRRKKEVLW